MEQGIERRKHERHLLYGNTAGFKNPSIRILDISLGGLSFVYDRHARLPSDGNGLAKMLFPEDEMCLDVLPVKAVSDCEFMNGDNGLRRCSICFDAITSGQRRMIQYFIWLNTRAISGKKKPH